MSMSSGSSRSAGSTSYAQPIDRDRRAHRLEHQLRVVARLDRFDHRGRAVGEQRGEQDRRLHLGARHAASCNRYRAAAAGLRPAAAASCACAPISRSGVDDPVHRPARQRLVAGQLALELLGGQQAGEQAHRRARSCRSRAVRPPCAGRRSPHPRIADSSISAPSARMQRRRRLHVGAGREPADAAPPVRDRPEDQRAMRDRLVARHANLAVEPPRASERSRSPACPSARGPHAPPRTARQARVVRFQVPPQPCELGGDRVELLHQVCAVRPRDARIQLRVARREPAHVAKPAAASFDASGQSGRRDRDST